MNDILELRFLDNSVRNYAYVFGIILFALFIKRFISKYLAGLLYKLIIRSGKKFNKEAFCNLLIEPLEVFLLVLVIIISFDKLNYPGEWELTVYKLKLSAIIEGLAKSTIVIVFIWLCLRIIDFIAIVLEEKVNLSKSQTDNQLVVFFKDFFKVLLVIIGGLLFIRFVFNKDIGNLLTGLSIVGAAIALATRESMENLIASFIIFFDKPFVTGDTVKVHNFTGTIEKIGLRSTRIRTLEKTYISVPNKQMVDSIVDNISLRTQRKADLRLELKLSVTTDGLKKFLDSTKKILQRPVIQKSSVHFTETGKNANVISIEFWCGMELSDDQFISLKEEINFEVMELVEQSGIDFATLNIDPIFINRSPVPPAQL
jgi:MscS family membrane protein